MLRPSSNPATLFSSTASVSDISSMMVTDPDKFMLQISSRDDYLSPVFARELDEADPLKHTASLFNTGSLIPFAGHSLGPVFMPVVDKIHQAVELQTDLHAGHFPTSHPEGNHSGHWFDCDRYQPAINAARQLLGFEHADEFVFTANGLTDNLAKLMDTFYRPGKADWECGRVKIAMLATDFFSDQAAAVSVAKRTIATAISFGIFTDMTAPDPQSLILKIPPDERGLYQTRDIIHFLKENSGSIRMMCLSDIVFSTGQRLDLPAVFAAMRDDIEKNAITIGLDLAHTIGNRPVDLSALPVRIDFAVACGYKHLCGFAGSSFGIYVSRGADLKKHPPLQGWKAADPGRVFATIHQYDPSIMADSGAMAFRTSNPPPVALMPAQVFLAYFGNIGFRKCFNKSECLTRYLLAQLRHHLNDYIDVITPQESSQRGAMIVFQVKNLENVQAVEAGLKAIDDNGHGYEVDVRPPNNIRITAHYGYTRFEQIARLTQKLKCVIELELANQSKLKPVF